MTRIYEKNKDMVRQEAIAWQDSFTNTDYSYGELLTFQEYFTKNGKKYGLLKEFKENGILWQEQI